MAIVADSVAVGYYNFGVSETERYGYAEFFNDLKLESRWFHISFRYFKSESRYCWKVFQQQKRVHV